MIMNTAANPPNETSWHMSKNVLNAGELNGSLALLSPGAAIDPATSAAERVLYVAQGTVTAAFSAANYILQPDETLLIPAGRTLEVRNTGDSPARVLTISLPSRKRESALVTLR